jgi:hypothetical protein
VEVRRDWGRRGGGHLLCHTITDKFPTKLCGVRAIHNRNLSILLQISHGIFQGEQEHFVLSSVPKKEERKDEGRVRTT